SSSMRCGTRSVPRAVLDPNVLISALITPDGASARPLLELRAGAFELVYSQRLLEEVVQVLRREKFRRYVTEAEVHAFADLVRQEGTLVDDPEPPRATLSEDPDDEYLVALARAARVEALVSGDAHLLRLQGQIPVLGPREFLEILGDR